MFVSLAILFTRESPQLLQSGQWDAMARWIALHISIRF